MIGFTSIGDAVRCSVAMLLVFVAAPVMAQDRGEPELPQSLPTRPAADGSSPGRTAGAASGRVGQRQTRESEAQITGSSPLVRVSNRVSNRVQSRLRNRIDRYYDPTANATSPFRIANDQIQSGPRR